MKTACFGLAAIALGCSITVAAAENPPTQMQEVLQGLAKQRAASLAAGNAATVAANGSKADVDEVSPNLTVGWNYAHASFCGWYLDSNGNQWFSVFPAEGGIVYAINNLYISQGLQISCAAGNWFAWFVNNPSTGAYNQTLSYYYK
jgi:hypothetical protein